MKALDDAELSLGLKPGWDKGLFRKGKALAGLKVSGVCVSSRHGLQVSCSEKFSQRWEKSSVKKKKKDDVKAAREARKGASLFGEPKGRRPPETTFQCRKRAEDATAVFVSFVEPKLCKRRAPWRLIKEGCGWRLERASQRLLSSPVGPAGLCVFISRSVGVSSCCCSGGFLLTCLLFLRLASAAPRSRGTRKPSEPSGWSWKRTVPGRTWRRS